MLINPIKNIAKRIRHQYRRFSQRMRYSNIPMSDMPTMFANSFPKSGTHLLTQVLATFSNLGPIINAGFPAVLTYDGQSGKQRAELDIMKQLDQLLPGDVGYGHLHAAPKFVAKLSQPGWVPYFIYRDPRDVVVSHVYYVTDIAPDHVHHQHYKNELKDFDSRLRTSILGRPELDINFSDIRVRFEPYLAWLEKPEVLCLRFEDFIESPHSVINRIFNHAQKGGFYTSYSVQDAIAILSDGIDPQRSPTFRSGKVGGWRAKFTQAHKDLFKQTAGDLLIQLGYEKNNDW